MTVVIPTGIQLAQTVVNPTGTHLAETVDFSNGRQQPLPSGDRPTTPQGREERLPRAETRTQSQQERDQQLEEEMRLRDMYLRRQAKENYEALHVNNLQSGVRRRIPPELPLMYGVRCPQNINDAYKEDLAYDASAELSRAMGHLRWRDAINKEIDKLFEYDCFTITDAVTPDMIYHQQCRYSWVFTVKPGGRELKARLVARGDTVDTEGVASYFSVVENSSTKIAMTAAHRDGQLTCTADVSNAYIGAPARELRGCLQSTMCLSFGRKSNNIPIL